MKATAEISLYPLTENYEQLVIDFILKLRRYTSLKVETNGLSTQVFGDYDAVMNCLTVEMKQLFEENKAVFVLKIAQGELTKDDLPEILK